MPIDLLTKGKIRGGRDDGRPTEDDIARQRFALESASELQPGISQHRNLDDAIDGMHPGVESESGVFGPALKCRRQLIQLSVSRTNLFLRTTVFFGLLRTTQLTTNKHKGIGDVHFLRR